MASNLVIVAIPAASDDVWKVSSEKVPHLTILFLGDAMTNPNVTKITDVVKENISFIDPFNLLVDHRGTLGDDEADVLFFSDEIPWKLHDFRLMLLGNQEISMAYSAIPQRQKWKPHLTLGYPESPAHSDDWDPMGVQYVQFDKIAVWYGDYEGPEFTLEESRKPSVTADVAGWAETVGNAIAHYGVKGMKWGVRRKNPSGPSSSDAAEAAAASAKAKAQGTQALSNKEMQALVNRMNLERQLKQLTPPSRAQKGAKFAGSLLANVGKQQAQLIVNDQVSKQIKKALS